MYEVNIEKQREKLENEVRKMNDTITALLDEEEADKVCI